MGLLAIGVGKKPDANSDSLERNVPRRPFSIGLTEKRKKTSGTKSPGNSPGRRESETMNEFEFRRELTPIERAAVCRATVGGGEHSLSDVVGETLQVSIGLIHEIEEIGPDGKPLSSKRLALVLADGAVVGSTSRSAISSFEKIRSVYGLPPYEPPIAIRIVSVRTKKGRDAILLHPM
jgi:hypothetical protein